MKKMIFILILASCSFGNGAFGQTKKPVPVNKTKKVASPLPKKTGVIVNNTLMTQFFKKYPDFKKYQASIADLYQKRKYKPIWFQHHRWIDLAPLLQEKLNTIDEEGITTQIPYKETIDALFLS